MIENPAQKNGKFKKLAEMLSNRKTLLIVMQNNPDPDSIAAAVALRKLANSIAEVQCSIAHGGTVGRAENRALVKYLGLNLRKIAEIDFEKFDLIAMVDTQPGTGNNSLPADKMPDIVIDHHPIRKRTRSCKFTDIRSKYGATATILYEYLKDAQIVPETKVATAMVYGIRSDTQDLGRDSIKNDMEALISLLNLANKRQLSEIQRGKVQREYFGFLNTALNNARTYKNAIVTSLGEISIPDMVGEIADMLLRDDEADWTMCYGIFNQSILISLRTSQEAISAEHVIKRIVSRRGTGGGHLSYAARKD